MHVCIFVVLNQLIRVLFICSIGNHDSYVNDINCYKCIRCPECGKCVVWTAEILVHNQFLLIVVASWDYLEYQVYLVHKDWGGKSVKKY